MKIYSFINNKWYYGGIEQQEIVSAVTGECLGTVSTHGIDYNELVACGRECNRELRQMSVHKRALLLKEIGLKLLENKKKYRQLSRHTGATRQDSAIDIDGGIGTMLSMSSIARRELDDHAFIVEGESLPLSRSGDFVGQHILTPKQGVSLHINAYNFPCWGMLEKIAPSLIAGVPVIVKPATSTCYVAEAVVRDIIALNLLPKNSIQLVSGSIGDVLSALDYRDSVTFTGSAQTANKLKSHPNVLGQNISFNTEADSLNCCIMAPSVAAESDDETIFIKEVVRELTVKAGQKCTAIRRVFVPETSMDRVAQLLKGRLKKVVLGDPDCEGVTMGPLVSVKQRAEVLKSVNQLQQQSTVVCGNSEKMVVNGTSFTASFFEPTVLRASGDLVSHPCHSVEPFGPVCTLLGYRDTEQLSTLVNAGKGSLVCSIVASDYDDFSAIALGIAPMHGRVLLLNSECAKESTGHGSPLAPLVHGGPGRAGGGEELGGVRAIKHYMQRTALQGSPTAIAKLCQQHIKGAQTTCDVVHPFRKSFDQLVISDAFISHRRTVTEADIVNFGCLSGDHFYVHFDETASSTSLFGKRVAHGYLLIAMAAGLFVDPKPGPMLANYGMDNLRFIEPVGIGDTIYVSITVRKKIAHPPKVDEKKLTGVVVWQVSMYNQDNVQVATYDILTLVERDG